MASVAERMLIESVRMEENRRCAAMCDVLAARYKKNDANYTDSVAHAKYLAARACAEIIRGNAVS